MSTVSLLIILFTLLLGLLSLKISWWRRPVDYKFPRILMYHMVSKSVPGAKFNKLRVSPARFEEQIQWLVQNGWNFEFLSDVLSGGEIKPKTVCLTFDDGFQDNYTYVHPILSKYNAKATLYLVVDRFNNDWSTAKKAHHNSGELLLEPKLSDPEVLQMLDSGIWELGGHTLTHANLSLLNNDQKISEISNCKEILASDFGAEIKTFAYPFGIFDSQDVTIVENNKFIGAVTTEQGISTDIESKFMLKRLKVSGKDLLPQFINRLRTGKR